MSFGENLQYYRAREGLTQEELAERLEVSRQSVSKWESNTSFPEMEKLMTLCSLFQTDLDTLVRGDAQAACQEDAMGYDRHMNVFSNAVAGGVGLILLGIAAALGLYGLAGMPDTWCGAVILSAIAVAVAILVVACMNHDHYVQLHPTIPGQRRAATAGRPLCSPSFCWILLCLSPCWCGPACVWRSTRSKTGTGSTTPALRPRPGAKRLTASAGPSCWLPPFSFWLSALEGWHWSTTTKTPSDGVGAGSSTLSPECCALWSAISWMTKMKNKVDEPSTWWRAYFFRKNAKKS